MDLQRDNKKSTFAMTILVITLLITSLVPAVIGEPSGGGGNQYGEQGGTEQANSNGPGYQTQEQTQEQNQNGTCNGSMEQEQSQERNQEQAQNGSCNGSMEQEQSQERNQEQAQNGSCNGSMEQEQNGDQDGTCDGNGSKHQYKEGSEEGNYGDEQPQNQWRHQYRYQIQQGAENGTIVMETTLSKQDGNMIQENNHYQHGMQIQYESAGENKVRMRVSAEFQEGKTIAINLEDDVLEFNHLGDLKVYFDGAPVEKGNVNEVVEAQGTEAKYIGAVNENGAQILVYIPHFSEHMIEIESLVEIAKEKLFTPTNYGIMAVGVFILIGIAGHVYSIGKSRK